LFRSVSNAANTLLAEVGTGFAIAVAVIILALTINTISDDIIRIWPKLHRKKGKNASPSPPGGGRGQNVHESKAQPHGGTENPLPGPSRTFITVNGNRGLRTEEARQRNEPGGEENRTAQHWDNIRFGKSTGDGGEQSSR
jgi:hypothetical protein